ncbi:hypothetical protein V8J88_17110 [Massilia sp. W12]|uniref:hypothetical protein n=1 Tax=Massilia sp. W12 TaxID=3126507 RepID=UPI0030CB0002
MANVNGITLAQAIRAVDQIMLMLEEKMRDCDPDSDAYEEMDMDYLAYMKAAHSLRNAYEEEYAASSNLVAYERLLAQR